MVPPSTRLILARCRSLVECRLDRDILHCARHVGDERGLFTLVFVPEVRPLEGLPIGARSLPRHADRRRAGGSTEPNAHREHSAAQLYLSAGGPVELDRGPFPSCSHVGRRPLVRGLESQMMKTERPRAPRCPSAPSAPVSGTRAPRVRHPSGPPNEGGGSVKIDQPRFRGRDRGRDRTTENRPRSRPRPRPRESTCRRTAGPSNERALSSSRRRAYTRLGDPRRT